MGKKNKNKGGTKEKSVFKVVGANVSKAKKAKTVTTNLKRLSHQMKSKTENADKDYHKIRDTLKDAAKQTHKSKQQKPKVQSKKPKKPAAPVVDMASAMEAFEKL